MPCGGRYDPRGAARAVHATLLATGEWCRRKSAAPPSASPRAMAISSACQADEKPPPGCAVLSPQLHVFDRGRGQAAHHQAGGDRQDDAGEITRGFCILGSSHWNEINIGSSSMQAAAGVGRPVK